MESCFIINKYELLQSLSWILLEGNSNLDSRMHKLDYFLFFAGEGKLHMLGGDHHGVLGNPQKTPLIKYGNSVQQSNFLL